MRAAYEALRGGRPDRALEHLAEHAARFPDGELAESREVTHMIALCQTGEVAAARTSAARFLAHAPHSPYAARVRLICSKPAGR
jgi:outer membrane protein assembly factor BamD (BamD/ComL family)